MNNTQKARNVLACISIQEEGNWYRIYRRVTEEDFPSDKEIEEALSKIKCNFITLVDEDYPLELKYISKPPFVIFYYGDLSLLTDNSKKMLAVIGSREFTEYGAMATRKIVSEVAKDVIVISGLAKGIDAIAHETVMNEGGKTIAVLGSGIDYCYPSDNYPLYKRIKEGHLVISEYPGRTTPNQDHFPFRNRLIAFFARSILVCEAGEQSGTSITVNWGLSFGREIMCVPHPIGEQSECNRLLKEGAILVENGSDVMENLH